MTTGVGPAKRLFLHIGAPKTGTTYLQTVMWQNRKALRQQHLLYPGRRRWDHFLASQYVRGIDSASPKPQEAWERLVGEAREWPGDVLISHEFFSAATAPQAQIAVQALAPAEVHIVFTARDYLRQLPSMWQEALKMGVAQPYDDFVARMLTGEAGGVWGWPTQDAVQVLARWGTAVPAERIHVVTVPQPGGPPEALLARWCAVVDIELERLDTTTQRRNELLGVTQAALLYRYQQELRPRSGVDAATMHRWFRGYLAQEVLVSQGGVRFGIPDRHVSGLEQLSRAAVDALGKAGYQVAGDLADLLPDVPAMPPGRIDQVSEAEMLDAALGAIDHMWKDVRILTEDRDDWRRRARAEIPAPEGANATQPSAARHRWRDLRSALVSKARNAGPGRSKVSK